MKTLRMMVGGVVATLLLGQCASATTFYVAPDGNDVWSGQLSSVNRLRTDGPLPFKIHQRQRHPRETQRAENDALKLRFTQREKRREWGR